MCFHNHLKWFFLTSKFDCFLIIITRWVVKIPKTVVSLLNLNGEYREKEYYTICLGYGWPWFAWWHSVILHLSYFISVSIWFLPYLKFYVSMICSLSTYKYLQVICSLSTYKYHFSKRSVLPFKKLGNYFLLSKYSWQSILFWFQVYNIMTPHL